MATRVARSNAWARGRCCMPRSCLSRGCTTAQRASLGPLHCGWAVSDPVILMQLLQKPTRTLLRALTAPTMQSCPEGGGSGHTWCRARASSGVADVAEVERMLQLQLAWPAPLMHALVAGQARVSLCCLHPVMHAAQEATATVATARSRRRSVWCGLLRMAPLESPRHRVGHGAELGHAWRGCMEGRGARRPR